MALAMARDEKRASDGQTNAPAVRASPGLLRKQYAKLFATTIGQSSNLATNLDDGVVATKELSQRALA